MGDPSRTADVQLDIPSLTACSTTFNFTVTSTELGPFTIAMLDPAKLPQGWQAGWATQSDARQFPSTSVTSEDRGAIAGQLYTWTPQPPLQAGAQVTFAVFGGNGVGLLGGQGRDEWSTTVGPCLPVATSNAVIPSSTLINPASASALATNLIPAAAIPPLSAVSLLPESSSVPSLSPDQQQAKTSHNAGIIAGSVVGALIAIAFLFVLCITHRKTRRESMASAESGSNMAEQKDAKRVSGWVPHSQAFARAAELYGEEGKTPFTPSPLYSPAPPAFLKSEKVVEGEEEAVAHSDASSESSIEKDPQAFGNDDASEVVSLRSTDDKDEDAKLHAFIPRYDSDNESGTTTTVSHPSAHASFFEPNTPPPKPWTQEGSIDVDESMPSSPMAPPPSTATHALPPIPAEDMEAETVRVVTLPYNSFPTAQAAELPARPGSAASWRARWGRLTDALGGSIHAWPYAPPRLSLSRSTSRSSVAPSSQNHGGSAV